MTSQDQALLDALHALRRALEKASHGQGYSVAQDLHDARGAIERLETATQSRREGR